MARRRAGSAPPPSAQSTPYETVPARDSPWETSPYEASPCRAHPTRDSQYEVVPPRHYPFGAPSSSRNPHFEYAPYEPPVPLYEILYEEPREYVWNTNPFINSIGLPTTLIAWLEYHDAKMSFTVCIGPGAYNFISKELYESIPDKHRPKMEATEKAVSYVTGGSQRALGTIFVPLLLWDMDIVSEFRVKIHAFVLEELSVGLFVSHPRWIVEMASQSNGWIYSCDFGNGKNARVQGEHL